MKPEIKERFLNALRSGKYNQCKGVCKNGDGCYCFTGVLLDLYVKDNPNSRWGMIGGYESVIELDDNFSNTAFNQKIADWAGLVKITDDENVLCYPTNKGHKVYWCENDQGKTLEELADMVEQYGIYC